MNALTYYLGFREFDVVYITSSKFRVFFYLNVKEKKIEFRPSCYIYYPTNHISIFY